jgi:ribosomal protein L25 (general stress protein Ctc)
VSTRPVVSAEPREVVGKKVSTLRRQGILPAVVYGAAKESQAIQLDAHDFDVLLRTTSRNTLVDLKIGSSRATPVLLQGIHEHPVRRPSQTASLSFPDRSLQRKTAPPSSAKMPASARNQTLSPSSTPPGAAHAPLPRIDARKNAPGRMVFRVLMDPTFMCAICDETMLFIASSA